MRMDPVRSDQIHHGRKDQGTGKLAYQAAFVKKLIRQPGLSPLLLRCLVQRSVSKTWEGYSGSTAAVSRSRKAIAIPESLRPEAVTVKSTRPSGSGDLAQNPKGRTNSGIAVSGFFSKKKPSRLKPERAAQTVEPL
jgi:hypothetical protein